MTEPINACSLSDEDLAARRVDWLALDGRALVRTDARPDGRLLVYRGGEETARALTSLIAAERRCCPSLHFRVERAADEVHVTVTVSTDAQLAAVETALGPA
jgi:hypothetical protein